MVLRGAHRAAEAEKRRTPPPPPPPPQPPPAGGVGIVVGRDAEQRRKEGGRGAARSGRPRRLLARFHPPRQRENLFTWKGRRSGVWLRT
jgi:hypothetical protein